MTKLLTPHNFELGLNYIFKAEKKFQPFREALSEIPYEIRPLEFWSIARVIIGQQLSGTASSTIASRVLNINQAIKKPEVFKRVSLETLRSCGVSNQKTKFLLAVADMIDNDSNYFDRLKGLDTKQMQEELLKIKGVGPWTATILTLFYGGKPDVMIKGDVTINKVIQYLYDVEIDQKSNALDNLLDHWRPFRSIGCIICYQLFDRNLLEL